MMQGWRWLEPADVDAVLSLRQQVLEALPDGDLYVREQDEAGFVRAHLAGGGRSLGLSGGDGELLAYAALTTLLTDHDLEEYAALGPGPGDCVLAAAMVHPRARGNRHQRTSIRLRLQLARQLGFARALCQVSMRNTASISSLIREGALLRAAVEYDDGRRRYLFTRDVTSPADVRVPGEVLRDVSFLPFGDWDESRAALSDGRVGRTVLDRSDGRFILVAAG